MHYSFLSHISCVHSAGRVASVVAISISAQTAGTGTVSATAVATSTLIPTSSRKSVDASSCALQLISASSDSKASTSKLLRMQSVTSI